MSEIYVFFIQSIKKSLSAKYLEYVIKLISLIVFARMFTPEEFGSIAILQVFIVFFMMISEVGIGPAIINFEKIKSSEKDGLFSICFIFATLSSVAFYFFLYFINYIYNKTGYENFGVLICVAIFFNTLSIVPLNLLYRERLYFSVMKAVIIAEIVSLICAVIIYKTSFLNGIWILSLIPCLTAIVKFLMLFKFTNNSLKFGRDLSVISKVWKFSTYQLMFNILNYFSRNSDNILVGKYIGMDALGIYGKAYEIMRYPLQLLTFAFSPAVQKSVAENYTDVKVVKCLHEKLAINLLFGGGFFGVIFFTLSPEIVHILLGDNWLQVSPLLTIFSFIVPLQVLLSSSGGFFQGMRRTDVMFKSGLFSSVTNVSAIILGISSGSIIILAKCLVVSFSINTFQCYYLLYKEVFKSNFSSFAKVILYGISPYALFIFPYIYIGGGKFLFNSNIVSLLLNGAFFTVCYSLCVIIVTFVRRNIKNVHFFVSN
ncbi:oligosaccharide flippase family protein [Photobacterium damselae]|uniref:oligosaccharide flippase family protein n=1 Tax=Photobacterium damselae TaxID=38293 RepID=UPI001EFD77E5|nr:oligosaccharide flippase family protein [Photobacterium damselae]MCG9778639.1 oligosaccharide flippase family protein [Photobacterium damselae]